MSNESLTADVLLVEELRNHYTYARQSFTSLVQWYTFYITANFIAGGWFISAIIDGKDVSIILLVLVSVSLLIAAVLAYIAIRTFQSVLAFHRSGLSRIYEVNSDVDFERISSLPVEHYHRIALLFKVSVLGIAIGWVVVSLIFLL